MRMSRWSTARRPAMTVRRTCQGSTSPGENRPSVMASLTTTRRRWVVAPKDLQGPEASD
ncbi:hypothetical protein GUITHDRAFT_154958, partial [Guillardia theta CCMP2712]